MTMQATNALTCCMQTCSLQGLKQVTILQIPHLFLRRNKTAAPSLLTRCIYYCELLKLFVIQKMEKIVLSVAGACVYREDTFFYSVICVGYNPKQRYDDFMLTIYKKEKMKETEKKQKKKTWRSHRDSNSDLWIQSPRCLPLHHGTNVKYIGLFCLL